MKILTAMVAAMLMLLAHRAPGGEPAAARPRLLIGYNEHRTNLPGGRHANVSTNRAMVVKADGTERRSVGGELVNEAGVWTQFAGWSPDGKWIVYGSKRNGVRNLFLMRLSDLKEYP